MRYYVEINGESSLNIQGLMIQSLPSISKPLMRSKQETIDGRDGDIVTKLGYSAYDKTLKIGLWGNYDINEVIAFFNQEGTIVFSNEPDKYYKFTILNRDDYVSQLDKFRTCTIALHCQPYKYKLNEEAEEIENEYVEQEGTSLSFTNTLEAPMNIDLKGNTLQNGTPTPSSPIPINNVSGDNQVVVCGKNLCNVLDQTKTVATNMNVNVSNQIITFNGSWSGGGNWVEIDAKFSLGAGTYKLSKDTTISNFTISGMYDSISQTWVSFTTADNFVLTLNNQVNITKVRGWTNGLGTLNNATYKIQIEQGNQATTYEAYNGTTYPINLGKNLFDIKNTPIENDSLTTAGITLTFNQNGTITANGTTSWGYANLQYKITLEAGTYYFSGCIQGGSQDGYSSLIPSGNYDFGSGGTFTLTQKTTISFYPIRTGSQIVTFNNAIFKPMIAKVPVSYDDYEPYHEPIELNKIGTYQDYIYKENDKWYLHKETGKVVLNGSESWQTSPYGTNSYRLNYSGMLTANDKVCILSNLFNGVSFNNRTTSGNDIIYRNDQNDYQIQIRNTSYASLSAFTTMLGTSNLIAYYILATPTNTEITYTPLIEQLESIKNAMSKEGTTNVNQVNNDAPFIINASVLSGTDSITLTNEGNTTSKPTLTITGSGVVGVYLENIQMFNISLGTNETIIIDTENMEAYYGSQLKNRQVTGDYSKFALQSGTNNLKFTGLVTNVEITNYNRWI